MPGIVAWDIKAFTNYGIITVTEVSIKHVEAAPLNIIFKSTSEWIARPSRKYIPCRIQYFNPNEISPTENVCFWILKFEE